MGGAGVRSVSHSLVPSFLGASALVSLYLSSNPQAHIRTRFALQREVEKCVAEQDTYLPVPCSTIPKWPCTMDELTSDDNKLNLAFKGQHTLTYMLYEAMSRKLRTEDDGFRFAYTSTSQSSAAAFLTCLPSSPATTLSDPAYAEALVRRTDPKPRGSQNADNNAPSHCILCKQPNTNNHEFSCKCIGERGVRHAQVNRVVSEMFKAAGYHVTREPHFPSAQFPPAQPDINHRADLAIFDGVRERLIDIAVFNPLARTYNHNNTGEALEWYAEVKNKHYRDINRNADAPVPFVMDVFGAAGKDAIALIEKAKKFAKSDGKRFASHWWAARISVVVQRGNYACIQSYRRKVYKMRHPAP